MLDCVVYWGGGWSEGVDGCLAKVSEDSWSMVPILTKVRKFDDRSVFADSYR